MAGPPQMTTLARKPQQAQVEEQTREVAPAPNVLTRQPVQQQMMPSAEAMSDEELERELCNTWVVQYRTHLMYTLSTFWD